MELNKSESRFAIPEYTLKITILNDKKLID